MMPYESDYRIIVSSACEHDYESAEHEAQLIEKCTLLRDEDVHYGEVEYSHDKDILRSINSQDGV